MTITESFVAELTREGAATRRILERVPEEKLEWRPHAKSMVLGQLAYHVAVLPGAIARLLSENPRELPQFAVPVAESVPALLSTFDESIGLAESKLKQWGDAALLETFTLTRQGKVMFEQPRVAMVRSLMMNHVYHHRGQLSVYLRLLDVPLPSIYGPTADENPFA